MKKNIILFTIIGFLFYFGLAFGQPVYKWVDEKGIVHFTDDPTLVPEKYRGQIQQKSLSKEPPPSQPASKEPSPPQPASKEEPPLPQPTSSRPVEPHKMMEPVRGTPQGQVDNQRDMLGRGEEWWRRTANDWSQRLVTSRTNYENAYSEWKAKEKELEESKFKPDSLKRKLKSEIKILEEKAKDWEKQMNDAKNMIENVLPNQARDYRANPEWLKIEEKRPQ